MIKNLKPDINSRYEQGYYVIKNKEKYRGDTNKIIIRSSYEKRMCQICDVNENIIQWSSEPIGIKYLSPLDNKEHTYWLDFWFKTKDKKEYIIEVKPSSKLKKPKKPKKITEKSKIGYNNKLSEYIKNYSKFKAATKFAKKMGVQFIIADEKFLFNK